jgi:hypothetical protein
VIEVVRRSAWNDLCTACNPTEALRALGIYTTTAKMARKITAEVDSYFKDKDEERHWQFLRIESEAKGETLRTVIGPESKALLSISARRP